jgi:hypothetical protein
MNLLASTKAVLARFTRVMEFCHDCGVTVEQVWTAPDVLWKRFSPDQGPRCIRCFDKRAQKAGVLLRWRPENTNPAKMTPPRYDDVYFDGLDRMEQ